jgi:hypothetical protein
MYQRHSQPSQPKSGTAANGAPPAFPRVVAGGGPLPTAARASLLPMVEISIQRLEEIVEQETFALKNRQAINLKDYNDRKSQALLELTRTLRNVQSLGSNPELLERIGSLKKKLAANQAMLKLHLEAVREISTSLSDAIRHSESDGTYTQAISLAYKRS